MRINILVFLPGPHRLQFEADWEGDEVPMVAQVTKAMYDHKLIGPNSERVYWENAIGVMVTPAVGEVSSSVRSVRCAKCNTGIILAPTETESGIAKWIGSCPACGSNAVIDERDL